jgi:hypothetical protein
MFRTFWVEYNTENELAWGEQWFSNDEKAKLIEDGYLFDSWTTYDGVTARATTLGMAMQLLGQRLNLMGIGE